jgi:hypothetical protein
MRRCARTRRSPRSTVATSLHVNLALATGDVAGALDQATAVLAAGGLEEGPPELATAVGVAHAWAGAADEARALLDVSEMLKLCR